MCYLVIGLEDGRFNGTKRTINGWWDEDQTGLVGDIQGHLKYVYTPGWISLTSISSHRLSLPSYC